MQTPSNITAALILKRAFDMLQRHTGVLLLLAVLNGILSRILYAPANNVLSAVFLALDPNQDGTPPTEAEIEAASMVFSNGISTMVLGHVLVTLVTAFCLIPWARLVAPGGMAPMMGGFSMLIRRGLRAFAHLIAGNGLTVMAAIIILLGINVVASSAAGLGGIIMIMGFIIVIWVSFVITSTAHTCALREATDRRVSMITLWKALRPYLSPLVGALGTIFIACTLINIGVGNIVTSLLGDRWGTNIGLSLSGATVFLISALHIAGIYAIDDEINRST